MVQSVLLLGASGRLGHEIIRAVEAKNDSEEKLEIHAFVRKSDKLPDDLSKQCKSVIEGNALVKDDIRRALKESGAEIVVSAIGKGNNMGPTLLRSKSAKVLASVVKPGSEFADVRVICISSQGAGGSRMPMGYGIGIVMMIMAGFILIDHSFQERALKKKLGYGKNDEKKRLMILHATGLTKGKPKGEPIVYNKGLQGPTCQVDRADLAKWIIDEVCGDGSRFGTTPTITGRKVPVATE